MLSLIAGIAQLAVVSVTSGASLPNILFIVADDVGWKDLGYRGAEYKTPILDSMAEDGIDLRSYYVHPMCTPTRVSMLTGRWAFRTGLQSITTMPSGSKQRIDPKHRTVAQLLKRAGYQTHLVGKWHLGYANWDYTPLGKGFDTFYGMLQGYGDYYNHTTEGGFDFWDNKNDISKTAVRGQYSDELFKNRAIDIIEKHNNESPFYMYLAFQSIHTPLQVSPIESETYSTGSCSNSKTDDRKNYCNKVLAMDIYIGNVKDALVKNNLWDNTLVIFSTDNGGLVPYINDPVPYGGVMDTHGYSVGDNSPLRGGKSTYFEGGVRGVGMITGALVPSLLKGTKYENNNFLMHAIDWLPTILGFIGKPDLIPDNIDGVNVWDIITSPQTFDATKTGRKTIFPMVSFLGVKGSSIIHNGWKLINSKQLYNGYYDPNGVPTLDLDSDTERYLFNIFEDPNEKHNLIDQHCEVAKNLQSRIFDQVCKEDGLYRQQTLDVWKLGCPNRNKFVWYPWTSVEGYDEEKDEVVGTISTVNCRPLVNAIGGDEDEEHVGEGYHHDSHYQELEDQVLQFYYQTTEFWHPGLTKLLVCRKIRYDVENSYCRQTKIAVDGKSDL